MPDTDNDRLEDWREQRSCSEETIADTDYDKLSDGDGRDDGQEVFDGTDPLDPNS